MTGKGDEQHSTPPTSAIDRLSGWTNTLVERVLLVFGSAICLILFAQVLCRYAGASLGWSEEVSRHLLVAITFLGSTAAYKRTGFIGLKGLGHWFGPGVARLLLVVMQMLTLGCFAVICWFGTTYTGKAWHHTTAALQLPMALPFAVIPIAAFILMLHVLADITNTLGLGRHKS
ncbi:MAG: TRAP transporter small permease [Proteobacteria bacterium]|nr:TRAP transporter small permease [Pseudomonadota bacterium]